VWSKRGRRRKKKRRKVVGHRTASRKRRKKARSRTCRWSMPKVGGGEGEGEGGKRKKPRRELGGRQEDEVVKRYRW
jgi:hypothetical protein